VKRTTSSFFARAAAGEARLFENDERRDADETILAFKRATIDGERHRAGVWNVLGDGDGDVHAG